MGYKLKKIYQGSNLVRPKWKPNANTIAYWKFEDNLNDTSGTSPTYNLTNNSATVSYSEGISGNCVNKGGTGYLQSSMNCSLFT